MIKGLMPNSFILISNYSKSRRENSINIFCYGSLALTLRNFSQRMSLSKATIFRLHAQIMAIHSLCNSGEETVSTPLLKSSTGGVWGGGGGEGRTRLKTVAFKFFLKGHNFPEASSLALYESNVASARVILLNPFNVGRYSNFLFWISVDKVNVHILKIHVQCSLYYSTARGSVGHYPFF